MTAPVRRGEAMNRRQGEGATHPSPPLYAALAASSPSGLGTTLGTITEPALAASCSARDERCAYLMVTLGSLCPRICWTS